MTGPAADIAETPGNAGKAPVPPVTSGGLSIGSWIMRNRVLLAPMSGVSDAPFRDVAMSWDAGLTVTEMVASRELARERPRDIRRARAPKTSSAPSGSTGPIETAARPEAPHVVQIAGCEPEWMAEGARVAESLGADVVDINMGCPAREVTGRLSGSALMRDPDHALSLVEATVAAVKVPVTLKMRLGWDERSINAPDIARRAEAAGVQMITVHGRTRCQFFKGRADWNAIRRVKDAVRIPVIANGDVCSPSDGLDIAAASGADGIMVGRGAYGAPWLLGRIAAVLEGREDPGEPAPDVQERTARAHYESMLSLYGREVGKRNARKHLGWYAERAFGPGETAKGWRGVLCREDDPARVLIHLGAMYTQMREACA